MYVTCFAHIMLAISSPVSHVYVSFNYYVMYIYNFVFLIVHTMIIVFDIIL